MTTQSASSTSRPREMNLTCVETSFATRSVPPVVPPRMNTKPSPTPASTPPKMQASMTSPGSHTYWGRMGAVRSITTEESTVPITVLTMARLPNRMKPQIKRGRLSAIVMTPIGRPNRKLSMVAIPVKPPGAMLFGALNTLIATA